jgi:pyrroloquinoline quinone biosynthesis protein E
MFCGVKHESTSFGPEADFNTIKSIIDKLDNSGILRINYFGGEPLVYPNIIDAIIYSKRLGMFNSMVTNGLLINEEKCRLLQYNLDAIAISEHGLRYFHDKVTRRSGAFDHVLRNIKLLKNYSIPVTINMTVTKENYQTIPEFVEFMVNEAKVDTFALNRCIPSENSKLFSEITSPGINELIDSLYLIKETDEKFKDIKIKYAIHFPYCITDDKSLYKYIGSCGMGQNYISIDQLGNLQMCSYTNKIIGNIFKDDLQLIWNNNKILKGFRLEEWLPNRCKNCEQKYSYLAGCKVSANKGYFAPDILLNDGGVNYD